jgi:PAS domain S-box-containing protein
MFKFYFDKRILAGFLLALTILSCLGIASYLNTKNLIRSSQMVAHTLDVLYNTERILTSAMNIELAQRGYSLTGNDEFLEVYGSAKTQVDPYIHNLLKLTGDNLQQQQRIVRLREMIQQLQQFSAAAIELRKQKMKLPQDLNSSLKGKHLMDGIRTTVAELEQAEKFLLSERSDLTSEHIRRFYWTFIGLLTTTGIILVVIFYAANVSLKAKINSEQRLTQAVAEIKDLYDNAPCGYHSLDATGTFVDINNTLLKWLGYKREEVLSVKKVTDILTEKSLLLFQQSFDQLKKTGSVYNLEFEFIRRDGTQLPVVLSAIAITDSKGDYVKSRSTTFDNSEQKRAEDQIKNLNKELEAFTYSVSHDLRAPLRSIDGYSRILQEDYFEKLDNEGKRVIMVIINNAKRMGKLIDDLLDFARLGRKDIARSTVNTMQLVNSIVQELVEQEPDRTVTVKVNPLASSYGDVDMLRQVWENLLSNALKYTSKKASSLIEISSEETSNEVIFQVKDNGVGFDMQYAPKLFGVFQRLHKIQDFSGTGVGLAIVKRIIDRHHGRVWAEGKAGEGATFYFTIPNYDGKS